MWNENDSLVEILKVEVVDRFYHRNLSLRCFERWKSSLSKYHVQPITKGSMVNACFRWMCIAFSEANGGFPLIRRSETNYGIDGGETLTSVDNANHLFPFYAVVEQQRDDEGTSSAEYFISRLRSYMIDKLEVPVVNLPLLVHAVALFDAHQLLSFFSQWQRFYLHCRYLDRFAFTNRVRRLFGKWYRLTNYAVFLKFRFNSLRQRHQRRIRRETWHNWGRLFQAIRYRQTVLGPRSKRHAFVHLQRVRNSRQLQRLCGRGAIRFRYTKCVLGALRYWIGKLSSLHHLQQHLSSQLLLLWLQQMVRRSWLESRALQEILLAAFGTRCLWYRRHRCIVYMTHDASSPPHPQHHHHQRGHGEQKDEHGKEIVDSRTFPSAHYFMDATNVSHSGPNPNSRHTYPFATPRQQQPSRVSSGFINSTGTARSVTWAVNTHHSNDNCNSNDDFSDGDDASFNYDDTLHTSTDRLLDMTTTFSPEEREEILRSSQSFRTSLAAETASAMSTATTTTHTTTTGGGGRESVELLAAGATAATAIATNTVTTTLLVKLKSNLRSRLSQGVLLLCARRYTRLRLLGRSLRLWRHRVPQLQLDNPHKILPFFIQADETALRNLLHSAERNYIKVHSSPQPSSSSSVEPLQQQQQQYYTRQQHECVVFQRYVDARKQAYAWRRWRRNCRRNVALRKLGAHLHRTNLALRQTFAFGAWLVTTGRHQQLRRTANRIVCNRFSKELWTAWLAWRRSYERVILVRSNDRELLRLHNEEVERFVRNKDHRRNQQNQYTALKDWALLVRDKKRMRRVVETWYHTTGLRALLRAWEQWRILMNLDVIANCIKKIYRGFRVRHRDHSHVHQYLHQFRSAVPKYLQFRRLADKRKIFQILQHYSRQVRALNHAAMVDFHFKRVLKVWRHMALVVRHHQRYHRLALVHYRSNHTLAVFTALRKRHRRLQYFLPSVLRFHRNQVFAKFFQRIHSDCLVRRHRRNQYMHFRHQSLLHTLHRWRRWHRTQKVRYFFLKKCRRYLLRKGWIQLYHFYKVRTRLRRWLANRRRARAKRFLREWRHKVTRRYYVERRAVMFYARHRFKKWFRWWYLETLRHSKLLRRAQSSSSGGAGGGSGGGGQKTVLYYMTQRGGRHFSIVRGVISSRVRWYLKKFSKFTSFRRRDRALMRHLVDEWETKKLRQAFERLHMFWHRASRRKRGGGLSTLIGRQHRGLVSDIAHWSPATTGTVGIGGGGGSDHVYHPHQRHGHGYVHGLGSTYGSSAHYDQWVKQSKNSLGMYGNHSNNHRYRHHRLIGIRHVIARNVPLSREEILQKLHNNVVHTPEFNQLHRGFHQWLNHFRYNSRNERAHARLTEAYWRTAANTALHRLHERLKRSRSRRFFIARVVKAQQVLRERYFVHFLQQRARRHLRQFRSLSESYERRVHRYKRRFFTRIYTICYFNRNVLKLKCVRRLKELVRGAVKKMRYLAWHQHRSPAALAIQNMDRKRKRAAFQRFRTLLVRGSYRDSIYRACDGHRDAMQKLVLLRFWRRLLRLKRRLRSIVRRLELQPPMHRWYEATYQIIRHRSIVQRVQNTHNRRTRDQILHAWRAWAVRAASLRHRGEQVAARVLHLRKQSLLYAWLRGIDHQVNLQKFQAVLHLVCRNALQKTFFLWHKLALLSDLCTWRSTQSAVRNWYLSAYWSQRQRLSYLRAEGFAEVYLAQNALYGWYRYTRRVSVMQQRWRNVQRLQSLKRYLVYFRRWKRRMYIAYRTRMPLTILQRDPVRFAKHRALVLWWRAIRSTVRKGRRRILRLHLVNWQSYTFKQRYARIAFLDRLKWFNHRQTMYAPFHAIVWNCQTLRMQKAISNYTTLQNQSRIWYFWRRLLAMRQKERAGMSLLIHVLYRDNVHRYFKTWRVKAHIFQNVGRASLQRQLWDYWRRAYAASLFRKQCLLGRVVREWRQYLNSIDGNLRLLLRRRRRLWRVIIRKMRLDLLRVAVALRRWHTGDSSIRLCQYWRHKNHYLHDDHVHSSAGTGNATGTEHDVILAGDGGHLSSHAHFPHFSHAPPLSATGMLEAAYPFLPLERARLYQELGSSQAGVFLTTAPMLESAPAHQSSLGRHGGGGGGGTGGEGGGGLTATSRRPAQRLRAIQKHLERRFSLASAEVQTTVQEGTSAFDGGIHTTSMHHHNNNNEKPHQTAHPQDHMIHHPQQQQQQQQRGRGAAGFRIAQRGAQMHIHHRSPPPMLSPSPSMHYTEPPRPPRSQHSPQPADHMLPGGGSYLSSLFSPANHNNIINNNNNNNDNDNAHGAAGATRSVMTPAVAAVVDNDNERGAAHTAPNTVSSRGRHLHMHELMET